MFGFLKKTNKNKAVDNTNSKKVEVNQISNGQIKDVVGSFAMSLLMGQQLVNNDMLMHSKIKAEFGYLFTKEDGATEGLFKIKVDDKEYYFGVQGYKVHLLAINELQYRGLIESMFACHECLRENNINETEKQKERRTKNNQYIEENGIETNKNLACLFDGSNVKLKSLDEISKRVIACLITVQISSDITNGKYKESLEHFLPLYKKFGLDGCLNLKEKKILDGTYVNQDVIDMDWAYEACWSLCWCLGLVNDIKDASILCDCEKAISFIKDSNSLDDFMLKCNLRPLDEILDMQDLYFRYSWAINEQKVNTESKIGSLNSSIVIERRRGLDWILSSGVDWYNLSQSA